MVETLSSMQSLECATGRLQRRPLEKKFQFVGAWFLKRNLKTNTEREKQNSQVLFFQMPSVMEDNRTMLSRIINFTMV